MNRRKFLGVVCSGLAAAVVASKLPINILPQSIRQTGAIDYLTRAYNTECKGKGSKGRPTGLVVGQELFEGFEGEISTLKRLGYPVLEPYKPQQPSAMYKSTRMTYEGHGWRIVRWVY